MKRYLIVALLTFAPLSAIAGQSVQLEAVCFTPGGDCAGLIVKQIEGTKKQILVQAYSFTSAPIAKAILDAHKRGVDVRVILDKSQRTEKYSSADFLANQDVPVWIDAKHAIAHNKIMIFDGDVVLTGSFNFTKSAQGKNAENVIVLRDKVLAATYAANWQAHLLHAEKYVGKGQ